jgi:hypothetical protein
MSREWIDEYIKLAFPFKASDLKIEEAQRLKYENIPSSLFRYRSFDPDGYNIENLKNGVEWQSYPSEFNDPFDARLTVSIERLKKGLFLQRMLDTSVNKLLKSGVKFSVEELERINSSDNPVMMFMKIALSKDPQLTGNEAAINELAMALDSIVEAQFDEIMDKFRDAFNTGYLVTCFSEEKDNVLMWSHYAQDHTGFCIEYDFKSLGPSHPRTRMLFPVIYKSDFFDATEYYMETLLLASKGIHFNNLFGIYPTIWKSNRWEYEKEWRTVFPWGPGISKEDKEKRFLCMPKPKKLYVGAKVSDENRNLILEIARKKKIPVYQMTLGKDSFNFGEEIIYTPE